MDKKVYLNTDGSIAGIVDISDTSVTDKPFEIINIEDDITDLFFRVGLSNCSVVNGKLVKTKQKPATLTPRQARLALLQTGLLDELETAIANDRALGIWWEYSLDIQRTNPELLAFASAYGLTEQQLDDLFELGATL